MNVLFITWDGPQVVYLETLFLPIFRKLSERNISFFVLQFNWNSPRKVQDIERLCAASGVQYRSVNVWRKPISIGSYATSIVGALSVLRAIKEWKIDVLMPRGILPGLTSIIAKKKNPLPIVFDADGLPADERVEFAGQSAMGLTYRLLRDIEAQILRHSKVIVTRSSTASEILSSRAGPSVPRNAFLTVVNGKDDKLFSLTSQEEKLSIRKQLKIPPQAPLIVYSGSLGAKYRLDVMLRIFMRIKGHHTDAFLLILTPSPSLAKRTVAAIGADSTYIKIMSATPEQLPQLIGASDLGLAVIEQTFSMQAASAIKIGEYLLCGVPVIATKRVGENSTLPTDVAYLMEELTPEWIAGAANWFTQNIFTDRSSTSQKCRSIGLERFSLEASARTYSKAFERLDIQH